MIHKINAQVISNIQIAENIYLATLQAPDMAKEAHPGQFIELEPIANQSIINRPMAIYDADPESGEIKIGYHAVGANTYKYARAQKGDTLNILGPLGKKHEFDFSYDKYIVVGGGIGITSLHLIGKYLSSQGKKILTLMGARSKNLVSCKKDFEKFGEVKVATDDGSEGRHGYIHELLEQIVGANGRSRLLVVYCGPPLMMKSCAEVCNRLKLPHLAIMEEMMACGFGICAACVCQTTEGQKKVCTDGPVFDGSKVVWEPTQ